MCTRYVLSTFATLYIYNLLEFFTLLNFQLHVAALAGMCVVPLLTIGYLVTLAQHMKHEIFDLALFLSENQSYCCAHIILRDSIDQR